jgi:hypothetical protein
MSVSYDFLKRYIDPDTGQVNFIEIDYDPEKIRIEKRLFNIRTYDVLRKNKWGNVDPVNRFIRETLDESEYDQLVQLFVKCKRELVGAETGESIVDAVVKIDNYIYKTFKKLGISARVFDFVCRDQSISLPDFTNIGTRDQDTPEKTFYEDDYHLINTIVIIAKMLCPLFGDIINRIKLANDSYKSMKEIVAFGIINNILREDFEVITKKLMNYIGKMIDRFLSDDPMITFNGITATSLTNYMFAKIIVKNFTNLNLYEPDGNVIRSVCVTLKRSIENETKGATKLMYRERFVPETSDDDQNTSLMENSINTVNEPVETPVIVHEAIEYFISDFLEKNSVDKEFFEELVRYYKVTILQPTPVNELIVALFVADPIGSAYCVKYMDMDMMIRIIVIIQIYAMNMGFKSIIPILSLIPTNTTKTEINDADNRIILNNGRGNNPNMINYFIHLNECVGHIKDWNGFNFTEYMKIIMMYVIENIHIYNVAPGLLNISDTGTTYKGDDDTLKYDENIIAELHSFMYHLLKLSNEDRSFVNQY